jgi:ATP-dependent DNA helicase RecQ
MGPLYDGLFRNGQFYFIEYVPETHPRQGMDIKDIRLVVQWRLTCDPTTLWQHLGRAGRDCRTDVETTGVFLVEKEQFDDEKAKKVERSKKRSKKRKRKDTKGSLTLFPNK